MTFCPFVAFGKEKKKQLHRNSYDMFTAVRVWSN